ncbi:hypothetical protein [Flavobacterium sp.]|uniref:hypothetical protein n=1 Tax=Flavobacterium sp. TaxID=239 RepID=UPI00286E8F94|nr:hypothetical protein [Flavobacterium sp.]
MKEYYNNLKPLHLFLFGTALMLLARTAKENLGFEMGCLFAALFLYILALVKYVKKKE